MAVPPAPDDRSGVIEGQQHPRQPPESGPDAPRPGARRLIAAVLLVVLSSRPRPPSCGCVHAALPATRRTLQAQREKVMSQARQFILRVNTYGPELLAEDGTMPEYREQVLEVITDEVRRGLRGDGPRRRGDRRPGRLLPHGPRSSAPASRSSTATPPRRWWPARSRTPTPTRTTTPERVDDLPLPFRVQIELVKVDGEWLVDNFTPVTGEAELPADGAERTPSAPLAATVGGGVAVSAPSPSWYDLLGVEHGRLGRRDPRRVEGRHRRPGPRRPAVPAAQPGRRGAAGPSEQQPSTTHRRAGEPERGCGSRQTAQVARKSTADRVPRPV